MKLAGLVACLAASAVVGWVPQRVVRVTALVRQATVPSGGSVLCVGNGPVLLMAAKRAALEGFDTSIIGGGSTELYESLLYEDAGDYEARIPNLKILETITGAAEKSFDELLRRVDAVLVAIDGDDAMSDGLLDVVIPEGTAVKRVVVMSRHLNGKGLGPFVSASKSAANKEVWAGDKKLIKDYARMETKVKALCARCGADFTVVRAGTLKGGGPGSDDGTTAETARLGLNYRFYSLGQQDVVNWRLLFDAKCQGVVLTPGDRTEGPGLGGVFAATSSAPGTKGDSGRLGVAGAMVKALRSEAAANRDFGVGTAESRAPPTDLEWDLEFAKLE